MTNEFGAEQTAEKTSSPPVISFFRPHSPFAKDNFKLTIILVAIWALAVFGFQFLLIALQTPTPEPAYHEYTRVWGDLEAGKATEEQSRTFSRSLLSVLGKNVVVRPEHRAPLGEALSATVLGMLNDADQAAFSASVAGENKSEAVALAIGAIGLEDHGFDKIKRALLPSSLVPVAGTTLSAEVLAKIPEVMDRYLIHNRSALTDFTFMGFPFHYWYTSQFLLILFIVLCFVYSKVITVIMVKHGRIKAPEVKA